MVENLVSLKVRRAKEHYETRKRANFNQFERRVPKVIFSFWFLLLLLYVSLIGTDERIQRAS